MDVANYILNEEALFGEDANGERRAKWPVCSVTRISQRQTTRSAACATTKSGCLKTQARATSWSSRNQTSRSPTRKSRSSQNGGSRRLQCLPSTPAPTPRHRHRHLHLHLRNRRRSRRRSPGSSRDDGHSLAPVAQRPRRRKRTTAASDDAGRRDIAIPAMRRDRDRDRERDHRGRGDHGEIEPRWNAARGRDGIAMGGPRSRRPRAQRSRQKRPEAQRAGPGTATVGAGPQRSVATAAIAIVARAASAGRRECAATAWPRAGPRPISRSKAQAKGKVRDMAKVSRAVAQAIA